MPRFRILVLLAVLGTLLGPIPRAAQASPDDWRVDGFFAAVTNPPPDNETLGLNRVSGPNQFLGVSNGLVIDCGTTDGHEEHVLAELGQAPGYGIDFWADEDITDGFGEISPTDTAREFEAFTAIEFRDDNQVPDTAAVRVRVIRGRFHRIANLLEVDLRLDIRVVRESDGMVQCQTRSATLVDVRIDFTLTPVLFGSGFDLFGVITRQGVVEGDSTSVARTVCDQVDPFSTRVDLSTVNNLFGRPGNPFHPCAPRYFDDPLPTTSTSSTTTTLPMVTTTSVTIPSPGLTYVSNDCDGGTNAIDGFVGSGYLKLRSAQSGDQTWVCVAVDGGSTHVGGKVTMAAGTPTLKTLADCQDPANVPYRVQHRDGTLLNQPYWIDVLSKPTEVWVCAFYMGVGSGVAVPTSGVPNFTQDPGAPYLLYSVTPQVPGKASSDCQNPATGGTKTQLLNAEVVDTHVWAYTRQSGSVTQVCARVERPYPNGGSPAQSGGVRLSVDSAGSQTFVIPEFPTDDSALLSPSGPCDFDIITDTSAFPELIVRTRDPMSGSPAYVCLRVAGTRLRLKVDAGGNQTVVGVTPD